MGRGRSFDLARAWPHAGQGCAPRKESCGDLQGGEKQRQKGAFPSAAAIPALRRLPHTLCRTWPLLRLGLSQAFSPLKTIVMKSEVEKGQRSGFLFHMRAVSGEQAPQLGLRAHHCSPLRPAWIIYIKPMGKNPAALVPPLSLLQSRPVLLSGKPSPSFSSPSPHQTQHNLFPHNIRLLGVRRGSNGLSYSGEGSCSPHKSNLPAGEAKPAELNHPELATQRSLT